MRESSARTRVRSARERGDMNERELSENASKTREREETRTIESSARTRVRRARERRHARERAQRERE